MLKIRQLISSIFVYVFIIVSSANASLALFDETTDTIAVNGQTMLGDAFTIEVGLIFTAEYGAYGSIFNEWLRKAEDKYLGAGPNQVVGYAYGLSASSNSIYLESDLDLGQRHHLAFVYDGTQEKIYIDGQLEGSRSNSGNVRNSPGGPFIGAIYRDGGIRTSFIGYIDYLRISNSARYVGSNFTPAIGELVSDPDTVLLYNFNESPGSEIVYDHSGNGNHGRLGLGFSSATSPQLVASVPIPSAISVFGIGLLGLAVSRRKG